MVGQGTRGKRCHHQKHLTFTLNSCYVRPALPGWMDTGLINQSLGAAPTSEVLGSASLGEFVVTISPPRSVFFPASYSVKASRA